ncbi:3'-5' exonuclease [Octadecabacter sp. 1_MG-2023]|uniref:3'-5' exonuclease n=1 Tax=unclassified Octadecabacter TaxID=196158 RepID=UPI001C09065D|nr:MULTISPECIES: 3'-5' exonuclease [unclassified Octadecabacter]MBU2994785.1 3'-5' exonuclease [Octadecabacter sp. B2R22]MDO6733921.1 3'-5' exonuclease [Octadecabacter sp. 1_MG-2023]
MNKFGHLTTLPDGPFRFIALDVETAGNSVGSICQIGLCFVGDTGDMQTYSVLIDPEVPFEPFNTQLHGISAQTVAGAGTFPTVYGALFEILNGHSLVQHSTFDEKALTSACARYGIPMITSHWTNSVSVARQAWPELKGAGGHGLANLKKHLGLEFHHHDAGEDARAAATVVLKAEATLGSALSHLKTNRQLAFQFEDRAGR